MLLLLAAPPGLEPRKPASETGVLPIRLKGNMAGEEGFEPPNTRVKVSRVSRFATPQYKQGTKSVELPIVRFVKNG